jgi:hypothetical protein
MAESTLARLVGILINSYRGKNAPFQVVLQSVELITNITTILNDTLLYLKCVTLKTISDVFQELSKPFRVITQLFVSQGSN